MIPSHRWNTRTAGPVVARVLAAALIGCATDGVTPYHDSLVVVSGDGQHIAAGDTSAPLQVQILRDGAPLQGALVHWGLALGTATLTDTVALSSAGGFAETRIVENSAPGHRHVAAWSGTSSVLFSVDVDALPPENDCSPRQVAWTSLFLAADSLTAHCTHYDQHWVTAEVPYSAWRVNLVAGQGYLFRADALPVLDLVMQLFATADTFLVHPLALSDDNTEGLGSEFFFIAPANGSYTIVVSGFSIYETGPFVFSARACPVIDTLTTSGTFQLALPSNGCWRRGGADPYDRAYRSVKYGLVSIPANAFDSVTINVAGVGTAALPDWEAFGPGMDTYGYVALVKGDLQWQQLYGTRYGAATSSFVRLHGQGGMVTLAVGWPAGTPTPGAAVSVTITHTPTSPAPATTRSAYRPGTRPDKVSRRRPLLP